MKITVKTIQRATADIDVEPTTSILEVKQKVHVAFPQMEVAAQTLIHRGKILADANTIADYPQIIANEKLIVVAKQFKPSTTTPAPTPAATPPSVSTSTPATVPATPETVSSDAPTRSQATADTNPAVTDAPRPTEPPSVPTVNQSSVVTNPPSAAEAADGSVVGAAGGYDAAASALVVGSALEETIANICAMGFSREDVTRALQAAFNNPDRAVEYLTSGVPIPAAPIPAGAAAPTGGEAPVPATPVQPAHAEPSRSPIPSPHAPVAAGGPRPATRTRGALDALRQHSSFEAMRQSVQADPHLLPSILSAIATHNPDLARVISENQQEFLALLAETPEEEGEGDDGAAGQQTLQVTPEQQAAIQRMQDLGFASVVVLQALVACDWNEEIAANYLFDHGNELESDEDF